MATFQFELVSPDKQQFRGAAESVLVPGSEGDFLVLKDHAAMMTSLRPGVVEIEETAGKHLRFFVRGGFADVNPGGLIVLAETAIPAADLNAEAIAQEIKNAEEDLADASAEAKQAAQEKLDRLRELKRSLKLEAGVSPPMKIWLLRSIVTATTAMVAVSAFAAELPSKNAKSAPPVKSRSCEIDGQPGFELPGSETCIRISGYISAGVTAGNIRPGYTTH